MGDASGVGVPAVLPHKNDGKLYQVGYASRKLNLTEIRYRIIEKECLAVAWGVTARLVLQINELGKKQTTTLVFKNKKINLKQELN